MVKGIAKRVVMVKSPGQSIFEQAIFIIKDEACLNGGISAEKILNEASSIADRYLSPNKKRRFPFELCVMLSAIAGASVVGVIWALVGLLS